MRGDMDKVIIERPRNGRGLPGAKTRLTIRWDGFDGEYDTPRQCSSGRHRQYGYKAREFSDLLGPLRRFLQKRVGRKWNDVYSEIRRVIDYRKMSEHHLLEHVKGFILTDEDRRWKFGRANFFFIDDYGILRACESYKLKLPIVDIDRINISEGVDYARYEGIWYYERWEKTVPENRYFFGFYEVDFGYRLRLEKKQLNKKDLKKLHVLLEKMESKSKDG